MGGTDAGGGGHSDRWVLAAAGITAFVAALLYLRTLAPGLVGGDSGDLISAAWVLGVAHPPGYPLYTMLAHLAALLPIGEPAWRINLFSAVAGALAVALVGITVARVLPASAGRLARTAAIVVGAGALALSTAFWSYSIVAEVFALNALFAALILLLAIAWAEQPRRFRLLWALGLVGGLSLAHHQTIVLLGPSVLVLLGAGLARLGVFERSPRTRARDAGRRGPAAAAGPGQGAAGTPARRIVVRQFALSAGLLLVGLLAYAYLPLAARTDPPINWGDPVTLDRFLDVVARVHYGSLSLTAQDQSGSAIEHIAIFLGYLWQAFGPVGCALAVLGLIRLRRRPAVAIAFALGVIFAGPVFVAYASPSTTPLVLGILERFSILPSVPMAMLVGVGGGALVEWTAMLAGRVGERRATALPARLVALAPGAVALALAGLLLATAGLRLGEVDQSDNRLAEAYATDMLELLSPDAILLMRGDENYTAIAWAQHVAGIRPDVSALDIELLKLESSVRQARAADPDLIIPFNRYDEGTTSSMRELVAANIERRPIYIVGALKDSDPLTGYSYERYGLVRRIVPFTEGDDEYSLVVADPARLAAGLRFPERRHPPTTWESVIEADYGRAAFDLAYVAQSAGRDQEAIDWYRRVVLLDPEHASALKNLGLLLYNLGGHRDEVVMLWTEYLRLRPDDPEAAAIRAELAKLGAAP